LQVIGDLFFNDKLWIEYVQVHYTSIQQTWQLYSGLSLWI